MVSRLQLWPLLFGRRPLSLDGFSAPAPSETFAPLCRTRCSRPESGAMTSSPSVTIILVYVAAASYLIYWVGLMGIHLIAILYG